MNNDEIDPFSAERILDMASSGETFEGFEDLGSLLSSLHEPPSGAEFIGSLPATAIVGSAPTSVGRLTRRVAIGATVAVLTLSGAAAALTGNANIFEPIFGPADSAEIAAQAFEPGEPAAEAGGSSGSQASEADPVHRIADGSEGEGSAPEMTEGETPEAETVDASDGLSDEELEILCDQATNHGEYVSAVAHDKTTDEPHGQRVSEAAQTDCGKTDDDTGDEPDPEPGTQGEVSVKDNERSSKGEAKRNQKADR